MPKFHKLKVAEVKRESTDCVSIVFDIPEELKAEYKYIQGQYLTLKVERNGEEHRRSYSLCSSPTADTEWRIAAKEVPGGAVSPWLNKEVEAGDEIEVMTPMGNFYTTTDSSNNKTYLLFAGGSGITPIISILKTVLNDEPNSSLMLFYANRNKESIVFKKEIDTLLEKYSGRVKVYYLLDEGAEDVALQGIVTEEKASFLLDSYTELEGVDEVFICGPTPMMENVKAALKSKNVPDEKIHIEYFTAVLKDLDEAEKPQVSGGGSSHVTVVMDGEEFEFELASDGPAILDAAIDAGADAPFSCKGAVCCTCKAKITEGKAMMDMNYALTDEEVESGFVLTCQAHPVTDTITVDYDELF